MTNLKIPKSIKTDRLHLRCWKIEYAEELLPILKSNVEHLNGWIPERVSKPVPLKDLRERLSGYENDFISGKAWRFAMFTLKDKVLLGEVDLFPRNESGRANFESADSMEIGYWLRSDETGKGYATEGSQAMMNIASSIPKIKRIEIHHDKANLPSAEIPKRLGFKLSNQKDEKYPDDLIWFYELPNRSSAI
jgi:RimJ/RimL family protein N-acetyltransferase